MSDFIVRIDTARLSDKQAAAISGAIQGAVLAELGKLDMSAAPSANALVPTASILFHPEWRGLWLRPLEKLQDVKQPTLTVQTKAAT